MYTDTSTFSAVQPSLKNAMAPSITWTRSSSPLSAPNSKSRMPIQSRPTTMRESDHGRLDHEGADEIERAPERIPIERVAEHLRVVVRTDPAKERDLQIADLDR